MDLGPLDDDSSYPGDNLFGDSSDDEDVPEASNHAKPTEEDRRSSGSLPRTTPTPENAPSISPHGVAGDTSSTVYSEASFRKRIRDEDEDLSDSALRKRPRADDGGGHFGGYAAGGGDLTYPSSGGRTTGQDELFRRTANGYIAESPSQLRSTQGNIPFPYLIQSYPSAAQISDPGLSQGSHSPSSNLASQRLVDLPDLSISDPYFSAGLSLDHLLMTSAMDHLPNQSSISSQVATSGFDQSSSNFLNYVPNPQYSASSSNTSSPMFLAGPSSSSNSQLYPPLYEYGTSLGQPTNTGFSHNTRIPSGMPYAPLSASASVGYPSASGSSRPASHPYAHPRLLIPSETHINARGSLPSSRPVSSSIYDIPPATYLNVLNPSNDPPLATGSLSYEASLTRNTNVIGSSHSAHLSPSPSYDLPSPNLLAARQSDPRPSQNSNTTPGPPPSLASTPSQTLENTPGVPDAAKASNSGSKRKSKSHTRKRSEDHIPRPPNAFILFRTEFQKTHRESEHLVENPNQNEQSKVLGKVWKELSEDRKKYWFDRAAEAKEEHKAKYPQWVYKPTPSLRKKRTVKNKRGPIEKQIEDERIQRSAKALIRITQTSEKEEEVENAEPKVRNPPRRGAMMDYQPLPDPSLNPALLTLGSRPQPSNDNLGFIEEGSDYSDSPPLSPRRPPSDDEDRLATGVQHAISNSGNAQADSQRNHGVVRNVITPLDPTLEVSGTPTESGNSPGPGGSTSSSTSVATPSPIPSKALPLLLGHLSASRGNASLRQFASTLASFPPRPTRPSSSNPDRPKVRASEQWLKYAADQDEKRRAR